MIVVITSMSIKSSAKRVATTLDSYLNRISDSTWLGSISEEGLEDIRLAIAKKSSRQTIVSCFKIRGYNSYECSWQIGNHSKSNTTGKACISRRKKQKIAPEI